MNRNSPLPVVLIVVSMATLHAAGGTALGFFYEGTAFDAAPTPSAMEKADFDEDGHLDIVGMGDARINILPGRGDGSFAPLIEQPQGDAWVYADEVGDLDLVVSGNGFVSFQFNRHCDDDGDRYEAGSCGGADCDDTDLRVDPGMDENCANGVDDDCDGLVDTNDPDCPEGLVLELEGTYEEGTIRLTYTIGPPGPSFWRNALIVIRPTVQFIPLWSVTVSAIESPVKLPVSFPFPSLGIVGVWTGLFASGGEQAIDIAWVDAAT